MTLTNEQHKTLIRILGEDLTVPAGYAGIADDDAVAVIQILHGCDEMQARFVLAIERGEITGDVVEVEE